MGKMNFISAIASAMFLFSSATAIAGSPYNLTIPAPGSQFKPHVAKPSLKQRPTINRSLGRVQRSVVSTFPYTTITKRRSRRQGIVSAGGARWNCTGNRCTTNTAWARPTVQTCKALARSVGAIQSYGKRGAGLNAGEIRLCNAGIVVTRSGRRPGPVFNRGLAARPPVLAPPRTVGSVASQPPRRFLGIGKPQIRSGFSPTKTQPRRGGAAALEQHVMKTLEEVLDKKGAEVEGKTHDLEKLADAPKGSNSRPPHRGGFAPAPRRVPSGTISGGFARVTPDKLRKHPAGIPNVVKKRTMRRLISSSEESAHRTTRKSEYLVIPGGELVMTGTGAGYGGARIQPTNVTETDVFNVIPGGSLSMVGMREDTFTIGPGGSLSMIGMGDGYLSSQVHEARIDEPIHFLIVPGGKITMTGMRIITFKKN